MIVLEKSMGLRNASLLSYRQFHRGRERALNLCVTVRDKECHATPSRPMLSSSAGEAFASDFDVAERGSMKVEENALILLILKWFIRSLCV